MEILTETTVLYAVIFAIITITINIYLRLSSKLTSKEQENLKIQEELSNLSNVNEINDTIFREFLAFKVEMHDKISNLDQIYINKYQQQLEKEKAMWVAEQEKIIRKDSVQRSRRVMRGQATEHLAPLIMSDLNIKDFRFVGNPIDYIVFSGASDVTDNTPDTQFEKIILLEIKSGKSRLNKVQRRIRDAVKNGKVEFVIYNPDTQETKTITTE